MDSSGCPDVDGPDAQPGRGQRTDGRSAGQRVVGHELLGRHAGRPAGPSPQRHPGRIGGVALVGVDLQQRTAVEQRLVGRVVPLRVVGVDRVAGVDRQADRPGQGLVLLVGADAAGAGDPGQHVGQQRARRSAPRRAAQLLVVERRQHLDLVAARTSAAGRSGRRGRRSGCPADRRPGTPSPDRRRRAPWRRRRPARARRSGRRGSRPARRGGRPAGGPAGPRPRPAPCAAACPA